MKIYAPVKDFNGLRNNVRFINGVGETNNLQVIEWFESHGYKVISSEIETKIKEILTSTEPTIYSNDFGIPVGEIQPDFEAMTPNQLRDYMKENGYGSKIKNIRNKEKLLEILRG